MGLFSKSSQGVDSSVREERERTRETLLAVVTSVQALMEANQALHRALRVFGTDPSEVTAGELAQAAEGITDAIQPISDQLFDALEALGPVASAD